MNRQIVASLILKLRDEMSRDLPKANAALKRHMDRLQQLKKATDAIGKYDKAKQNLQKLRDDLQRTREKIGHIKEAMRTADQSDLAGLRGMLTRTERHADKVATAMVSDLRRVKTAISSLNSQGIRVNELNAVRDRIRKEREKADADLDGDRRQENRGRIFRRGGSEMRSRGMAGVGYSVGAGYMAGRAIGGEYEFQHASNKARAKKLASSEEWKPVRDLTIELAKDRIQTPTELMQGVQYLAAAGLSQKQIMGALGPMADFATAGDLPMDMAADIATNIMLAMDMPHGTDEEVGQSLRLISDVLARTAADKNADVFELGQSFKYAAPMAAQLGQSIYDLAAVFGVMADAGIKASESGVAWRSAQTRMIKPTKPMLGELERLGIDLADFVKSSTPMTGQKVVDSLKAYGYDITGREGEIQSLIDQPGLGGNELAIAISDILEAQLGAITSEDSANIFEKVQEALLSNVDEIDMFGFLEEVAKKSGGSVAAALAYIMDVRQGSRITTAAKVGDGSPRAYRDYLLENSEGTTDQMAEIMMSGLPGDLKRLQSAFDTFMRTFFEAGAADVVTDLAEAATEFLKTLKEIDPRLLDLGAKFFALSLLVGPLIYAMGGVLSIAGSIMLLKGLAGKGGLAAAVAGAAGAGAISGSEGKSGKGGNVGMGTGRSIASAFSVWGIVDSLLDLANRREAYEAEGLSQSEALTKALKENWAATDRLNAWLQGTVGTPRSWLGLDDDKVETASAEPSTRRSRREARRQARAQAAPDDAESDAQAEAQINEIMTRALVEAVENVNRSEKSGRLGSVPIPTRNPSSDTADAQIEAAFEAARQPIPNGFASAIDGVIASIERQSGKMQPVRVDGAVTTQPSGVQEVRVTNPPPPVHAPISIVQHITSNASPSEIGRATGNAVAQAQRNSYADD